MTGKDFLKEKGYDFVEKDVNEDDLAREDFIGRGLRGVPAFLIGDEVVEGLDKAKIEKLMSSKVVECPNCQAKLRIPRDKGKIKVTCPKCEFEQIVSS